MSRSITATTRCWPTAWSTIATSNTLAAEGNVRIKDPDGAVITSDQITLTDDFRDGFIDALKLVTKDDTRIVAHRRRAKPATSPCSKRLVHAL